jgi:hypothetical protein
MRRKFFSILTVAVLSAGMLTVQSCKKQECPVDEPTKMEILLDGAWNGIKLEHYQNGNLSNSSQLQDYQWYFLDNHRMIIYMNGNISREYDYTVNGDFESFDFTDVTSGNTYHLIVVEFKEKSLILREDTNATDYYVLYLGRD